jgi:hypothetical protein
MNSTDAPFLNAHEAASHDWQLHCGEPEGSRELRCRGCGLLASNHGELYTPLDETPRLCLGRRKSTPPPIPIQAEMPSGLPSPLPPVDRQEDPGGARV